MYTLNLKVLLNDVSRTIGITCLIWFVTNLAGTLALLCTDVIGLPSYQIIVLSLVFSTPAFLVIAPSLMIQAPLQTRFIKYVYAMLVAIISCIAVIAFFFFVTHGYPLERNVTVGILTPYVIAALIIVPPCIYYFKPLSYKNNA